LLITFVLPKQSTCAIHHLKGLDKFYLDHKKLVEKLTPRNFISHSQSAYLKQRKDNMDNALILMDAAENY